MASTNDKIALYREILDFLMKNPKMEYPTTIIDYIGGQDNVLLLRKLMHTKKHLVGLDYSKKLGNKQDDFMLAKAQEEFSTVRDQVLEIFIPENVLALFFDKDIMYFNANPEDPDDMMHFVKQELSKV
jgi:hypothetical protein